MKFQDIVKLDPKELEAKLQQEQEMLQKLKLTHKINAIEKPMRIRHARKLIAKIKTAQNTQNRSK